MMELSKKIEEVLEKFDFSLCGEITERYGEKGKYDIELETYSPEGEDVIVSLIYDGTEEGFIAAFVEYANDFDAEEHAEMWIESRGKNGVPESIKDLLEDAEWQKNTFLEVVEALNSIDDEESIENNNKKALYDLMKNYFNDCEQNGYSDFNIWCEDNIHNEEQESLLYEMQEHVNAIAGILFLN